jgi:hypothetical protein
VENIAGWLTTVVGLIHAVLRVVILEAQVAEKPDEIAS